MQRCNKSSETFNWRGFYVLHPILQPCNKQENMTEIQMQSSSFVKLWNNRPELRGRVFAINQNSHNRIKGALNRSLGVLPGVSDMAYLVQGSVVWIEWKTETGSQSPDQKAFEQLVTRLGMRYIIVRSEFEFLEVIDFFA
jgi:hypothetical protein